MKKRLIRMIALLLTLLLLLSGCGKPEDPSKAGNSEKPENTGAHVTMPDGSEPDAAEPSASEKLDLPKEVRLDGETLLDICPSEDGYLLLSRGIKGYHLTSLDENLTVGETVDLTERSPETILEAGGHRWTLERADSGYAVFCDGELWTETERDSFQNQLVWADDTLYTVQVRQLWCGKNQVAMPEKPGTKYDVRCVVRVGEQTYALMEAWENNQDAGQWLCPIDANTTALSPTETIFPIKAEYACWNERETWLIAGSKLYRTDGFSVTLLCDLASLGVNISELTRILPFEDGTFLALQPDCLIRIDPNQKTSGELTIGLYYTTFQCDTAIAAFNRTGSGWRVTPKVFEDLESMNLAMLNGELDLICSSDTDMLNNYAVKGLLAPIDETTTARALPNLVALCTVNGACVYLPRTVELLCSSIPASYVAAQDVADLDRLIARIEEACPETFESNTKEIVLQNILSQCGSGWIDWEALKAHYDSDSFRKALEFCNRFEDDEYTAAINDNAYYNAGKELFRIYNMLWLGNYHYTVHGDLIKENHARTLFAFPAGGYTGLGLQGRGFYAIVNGPNASEGQAFLDFLFSDDEWYDEPQKPSDIGSEFPANLAHLDKLLAWQVSQTPSEEIEQDARELRELLLNADHLMDTLLSEPEKIILEEAETYFQGDITADEAARRIQNRIEIYLSERG